MKRIAVALSVLLVVSGCATFLESILDLDYIRTYPGKPLSRDEVAILTHRNPYSQEILFTAVDGQKTDSIVTGFIEFLPGLHSVTVGWANSYGNTVYTSEKTIQVSAQYKAGHTYIVVPNFNKQTGDTWNPSVIDISSDINSPEYEGLRKAVDDYFQRERDAYYRNDQ